MGIVKLNSSLKQKIQKEKKKKKEKNFAFYSIFFPNFRQ